MICPECNISGGCDCHITKRKRHVPRDHKEELRVWLKDLNQEAINDRNQ